LYADEATTTGNLNPPRDARRSAVTIVYNPTAGWRRRRKLIDVVEAMSRRGARVTLRETTGPGDAEAFAREAAQDRSADIVVAAGGDGTVNEVANGLAGIQESLYQFVAAAHIQYSGITQVGKAKISRHELDKIDAG